MTGTACDDAKGEGEGEGSQGDDDDDGGGDDDDDAAGDDDDDGEGDDDDGGNNNQCNPGLGECPEGEKCQPYVKEDGACCTDATQCVPLTGDAQAGEDCIRERYSDTCGIDLFCFKWHFGQRRGRRVLADVQWRRLDQLQRQGHARRRVHSAQHGIAPDLPRAVPPTAPELCRR